MSNKVAVININTNLEEAVHSAINKIGGFHPPSGSTIVIKPNLCSSRSSSGSGVTTDVRVVEAVVTYLIKHCNSYKIKIVESNNVGSAELAFKRLGYTELEKKYANVELKNLSKDKTSKLILPNGKKLRTLEVPDTLLFMDYLISVAKLKRHVFERYTGIWKNQYGCIPDKSVRPYLHPFLTEILYDVNTVFWPDLSIIDGIVSLEGPGPIEGTPKPLNKIICSKNPLSADIVGAKIAGINHNNIPHLKYALKHGYKDAKDISLLGDVQEGAKFSQFRFITGFQYFLYRVGIKLRRLGLYLENAGDISAATAFALRAMGFRQLAEGEVLSTKQMIKELKDLLLKFEASKRSMG